MQEEHQKKQIEKSERKDHHNTYYGPIETEEIENLLKEKKMVEQENMKSILMEQMKGKEENKKKHFEL